MDVTTPTTNSVDLRKTFDLNGKENDEMLRLYLRKAGLSDEIEYLTPGQRRAYIYDIIKSNQSPGYWKPSVLTSTPPNYAPPPPSVRPPPRPTDIKLANSTPYYEHESNTSFNSMRSSVSANSLFSLSSESSTLTQRFVTTPITPPSPTTFITGSKGSKYEISGPINFQHIAGDLTRDKTRNAFDLTSLKNDNVLKKYMIEHNISDEDIAGMRKQDVIRKIVQSHYTWVPPKSGAKTKTKQLDIKYATVAGRSEKVRPSISTTADTVSLSPITPIKTFPSTNFIFVSSRFADVSDFPDPNELLSNKTKSEQINRLSQIKKPNVPPPPPPPHIITATAGYDKVNQMETENTYDTLTLHQPRPLKANTNYMLPQPPKPQQNSNNNEYMVLHSVKQNEYQQYQDYELMSAENSRFRTFENTKKSVPPPAPKPQQQQRPSVPATPPPTIKKFEMLNKADKQTSLSPLPPPPPPAPATAINPPAPPPPPIPAPVKMTLNNTQVASNSSAPAQNDSGDSRDALMESIRKGISLKKVDRKAATINGVKPRATNRPQITDFLTELKMGITTRRIKNSEDNPFASDNPNESNT